MKHKELSKSAISFKRVITIAVSAMMIASTLFTMRVEAYDPNAAVKYASDYWNKQNSAYRYYGLDCTNFVSQCAQHGYESLVPAPTKKIKLKHIRKGIYKCKDYWFQLQYRHEVLGIEIARDRVSSSTWTSVDEKDSSTFYGFQDFMKNKKGKEVTEYPLKSIKDVSKLIKKAEVGDIVQYNETSNGRYTHSYIVGKKMKNSKGKMDLYFYSNTGARNADADDALRELYKNLTISQSGKMAVISMK